MILNFAGELVHQVDDATGALQAEVRDDQPAHHQHDKLQKISPGDGDQPAIDGVASGQDRETDDGDEGVQAEHALQGLGSGQQHHGHLGDDPQHQRTYGKNIAALLVVAALQELGHRVDAAAQIESGRKIQTRAENVNQLPHSHCATTKPTA
ncbi:MAG: hypothetical protein QM757_41485 [Paludibaculum sp.]